jgi:protein ImuB
MYACLHVPACAGGPARQVDLLALALEFSPAVEQTSSDTVVFPITPLEKLFGTPHQLASEIGRYGHERKLTANLALAANPDTCVLLARNFSGVTFAAPGHESEKLGSIVLAQLFLHDSPVSPTVLESLERWGLKTCEDLAALPERGVVERLGTAGLYLRNLALGKVNRPLRVMAEETKYEGQTQLDYPVETLEPLLFLFGRTLSELCEKLRSQSQAARLLHAKLFLSPSDTDKNFEFNCELEFPVPLDDSRSILKLLQLHLERHGPQAPVIEFVLQMEPVDPRRMQGGLFLPSTPAPDKLQITMARIAGMVGEENTGSPELLNTHRPDAFRLRPLLLDDLVLDDRRPASGTPPASLRLALRLFRPALFARVRTTAMRPKDVTASGVEGRVMEAAGPWRTSGDWWTEAPWARDEWDVELSDGALYRIYCESKSKDWYVQAVYD